TVHRSPTTDHRSPSIDHRPLITSTIHRPPLLPGLLMDVARRRLDVFDGSHGKDAVPEIEDMAGPAACALENVVDGFEDAIERREQHRRIEIALHGAVAANPLPRFVDRRAPVGADDV